jgi:hypothetical protein
LQVIIGGLHSDEERTGTGCSNIYNHFGAASRIRGDRSRFFWELTDTRRGGQRLGSVWAEGHLEAIFHHSRQLGRSRGLALHQSETIHGSIESRRQNNQHRPPEF